MQRLIRPFMVRLGQTDKYFALGGNLVRAGARMLIAVGLARMAGAEAYAQFVLLVAVEVIVQAISSSYYVAPMVTVGPAYPAVAASAVYRACLIKLLRWLGFALALGLLATPIAARHGIPPVTHVGFCLSAAAWALAAGGRGWRCAVFDARRALVAEGLGWGVVLAGLALAVVCDWPLMPAFWWASAAGGALAVLVLGWPADTGTCLGRQEPVQRRLRSMGRHMTAGTIANSICSRIQPFVLSAAAGATIVGIFGAASTLIGPLRVLSMAMSGVLRPRVALHFGRGEPHEVRRMLSLAMAAFLVTGAGLLAVFVLSGPAIVDVVFGPSFRGLERVLPWAAAFAAIEAVGASLVVVVQAGLPNGAAVATRVRTAMTVVALAVMWPACSLYGAAGAFAAATAVEAAFVGLMIWVLRAGVPVDEGRESGVVRATVRAPEPSPQDGPVACPGS
ncbi:MAG: lipopolysaccharide biosynthesis protein [Planctomycetota bacterium]|jgi:O-antigen/teichoic acid export membrane protein